MMMTRIVIITDVLWITIITQVLKTQDEVKVKEHLLRMVYSLFLQVVTRFLPLEK